MVVKRCIDAKVRIMNATKTAMDWTGRLAQGTRRLRRSAVREILKAAVRPEVISFGGGLPAPECFPTELIGRATANLLDSGGSSALQYGESEGVSDLRTYLAEGIGQPMEQVLITSGAQQGLDLLGRVLLDEGDTVAVENPTYLGALGAWRPHGVQFLPISTDQDGLCVDSLEKVLETQRPKFLYTMPNFQNPGGSVLSLERRHRLIALAEKHDLLIMEDDPYGDLRYDGEALPSLLSLAAERGIADHVVHLRSFSKVVAPGLRIGWLTAAPPLIEALVMLKQSTDFHPNTLGQRVILSVIQDVAYPEHLAFLRKTYGARRDAMVAAVTEAFPEGTTWTTPVGGMFLMAQLPAGLDAVDCLVQALEAKVAYVTIDNFTVDGSGRDAVRLNFTNASKEKIHEGIHRLGALFRGML
ncbi:MAG: 2-aminoadipate transaminase [Verrucomicrobiales bacterium]|jgi:2-aminoadipate transaminase